MEIILYRYEIHTAVFAVKHLSVSLEITLKDFGGHIENDVYT